MMPAAIVVGGTPGGSTLGVQPQVYLVSPSSLQQGLQAQLLMSNQVFKYTAIEFVNLCHKLSFVFITCSLILKGFEQNLQKFLAL